MLILFTGLLSQTAQGQHIDQNLYERSLLDSAILYERLKTTHFNLRTAYDYQGKEVEALRSRMRMLELQSTVQRQTFESQLADYKKAGNRKWWKGFRVGFGSGYIGGALTGIATH
jgi:hypothetical protein